MMGAGACQVVKGRISPMGWCATDDGRGMMWGMGLGALVAVILVALVIAALVKYVFFR
jgi:hypothetical protein